MNAVANFPWPKELHAVKRAAEDGTLEPRALYPVEIKALCSLVADVPLDDSPREIAPGMLAKLRIEHREHDYTTQDRAAYYFIARFANGRVWQCSLFTEWVWQGARRAEWLRRSTLKPRNIAQALTRIAPEGGQR